MTDPVIVHRLDRLERANESIAESLKALVRLEQHHTDTRDGLSRAWKQIETNRERIDEVEDQIPDKLDDRLHAIEQEMPALKMTSRWVIGGTLAIVAAAGTLIWDTVTEHRSDPSAKVEQPAPTVVR